MILYNNRTITLTISTYSAITSGIYGVAAVFATITMLLTIICLVVYLRFTKLEDVKNVAVRQKTNLKEQNKTYRMKAFW